MPAADLHCVEEGGGPGLVLLHPVGLDHSFWGPLVSVGARSHRVLSVDLRGHGLSPAAEKGLSVEDYVDDVHAAIVRRRLGPSVVLGLSFGGMIAQILASRYPEAVSGLVLCGCTGGFAPETRPMLSNRGLEAERGGMDAVVEPTIERWFTPPFRATDAAARVRERLLANDPMNWSAAWHAIAKFDAFPLLDGIRAPTLVVAGENDAATPVAAAGRLADAISTARLKVLPGAPHMMQIEGSEAFAGVVSTFLAEQRGTRATSNV